MVTKDIRIKVIDRVQNLLDCTLKKYGIIVPVPSVRYTIRSTSAGAADVLCHCVELNPILLMENEKEFLEHTVGHEVAHLVVSKLYNTVVFPHGKEWQNVMKTFALPPRITHRYDTSSIIFA